MKYILTNLMYIWFFVPGHFFSLQVDSSLGSPGQYRLELRDPSGNTHSLVLCVLPPPHVEEHEVHSLHSVHTGHLFELHL